MTKNYYDAVVLGTEIGPLAAGALLARRGFRVLVVGQDAPRDAYRCFDFDFLRRPFLLSAAESPALERVIREIGAGPLFQRMVRTPEVFYQVVLQRHRLDITADPRRTVEEIRRELPRGGERISAVLQGLGRLNGELDKLLANDLVIPPESFFERREMSRAEVQNPFRGEAPIDPLSDLDAEPELREILEAPVRLDAASRGPLPPVPMFRRMASWLFGCREVDGGSDGLRQLLERRIVGQGGDIQPRQRVVEIAVRKGRVAGVAMADRDETTGCQVVLTDLTPRELTRMVRADQQPRRFASLVEESPEPARGYGINLGVDAEVVPVGLGHTAFVVGGPGLGDDLIRVQRIPQSSPDRAALHVSCVVAAGREREIETGALRDRLLDRVRWLVPFLDRHLRVIHSPYDAFGPLALRGGEQGEAPPVPYSEAVAQWRIRPPAALGPLGIGALPHRSGIKGLILAGQQVVSGLGVEGELIAAWGAARIVGKMDPRRERLVRSMRSRVEV